MSEQTPQQQPRDDQPGGESTPLDTEGDGPVGLQDRTRERGAGGDDKGSPATNQAKAEPMPATPGHPDPNAPLEPPSLAEMNVGSADPQSPSHPSAGAPAAGRAQARPAASAPVDGTAHRAPGLQGVPGADEAVETDVGAGAAAMQQGPASTEDPGDAQGVPIPSRDAAGGTSEQQQVVRGARTASTPD